MRRALLVLAAAAVVVGSGCGIPTDAQPRALPRDAVPFGLLDPSTTTSTVAPAPVAGQPAQVFLVQGERLVPVERQVPGPLDLDDVLRLLLAGPTAEEMQAGVHTAIAPPAGVARAWKEGAVARVELNEWFGDVEGQQQILAIAQIVFTATALDGVDAVEFQLRDRPVEVTAGDGTLRGGPLGRQDFASVAPA